MVSERGMTLIEVVIALAVLSIAATVAFTAEVGQLRHVGLSFEETKASRLAAARLEELREDSRLWDRPFELPAEQVVGLPGATARQHVREVEPGLLEVVVVITWIPKGCTRPRRYELATWIERRPR